VTIRFAAKARGELFRIASQYDRKQLGLGDRFLDEVAITLRFIANYPEARQDLAGGVRLWPVNRFPYGILYVVEPETTLVLAVGHLRRGPRYWRAARGRKPADKQ
jgi:hypothetical protein